MNERAEGMTGGVPTDAALYLAVLPMNEKQDGELGSSLASRTVSVAKCEAG